jgi:hypothetical protein
LRRRAIIAAMVEYGGAVSQGSGQAVGAGHGSAGSIDAGAAVSQFVGNASHTISTMPPGELVLLVVAVFIGLLILRRVF